MRMTEKHISRDELLEIFIEDTLNRTLAEVLPEVIETVIPRMPIERQEKAFKDVQDIKGNPEFILSQLSELKNETDFTAEIDYESESYKYFVKTCDIIIELFDRDEKRITELYRQEYAKKGIELIIN